MPTSTEASPKILVTAREAAELLGDISERKLWSMTSPRGPIPVVRIGKLVRYRYETLIDFAQQQEAAGEV